MKYACAAALAALVCAAAPATAQSSLDFDDIGLPPSGGPASMPDGYGGFDWTNFGYMNGCAFNAASGYCSGATSGSFAVFNQVARTTTLTRSDGGLFSFLGASLTAAWRSENTVTLRGFRGGHEIFRQAVVTDMNAPTPWTFDFKGIDRLTMQSDDMQFVMDDMRFDLHDAEAVPEPATLLLLGSGLLGLGLVSRRRRRDEVEG